MEVLRTLEPDSVDACVTDPPYGLAFMGKHWDKGVPDADVWREVYRVLKPGAHLLSFFGTRTYHRGVVAIEDAGFEIRDQIGWLYGSGFPKSLDISKALDKAAGAEREVVGHRPIAYPDSDCWGVPNRNSKGNNSFGMPISNLDPAKAKGTGFGSDGTPITAPATEAAKQWDGWGTALKPAWEPIVLARKPLEGTVAANVLKWGTGGINVDGCRVPGEDTTTRHNSSSSSYMTGRIGETQPLQGEYMTGSTMGRFPANIIHDGSDEVLAEFAKYGESKSSDRPRKCAQSIGSSGPAYGGGKPFVGSGHNDSGTAARFFYTAKASKDDRNDGLWDYDKRGEPPATARSKPEGRQSALGAPRANHHPTVKPTSLMRYLVRLVTPKGGLVLDPFAGSGTTLIAAYREDCRAIGIELEKEYFDMAQHRIDRATAQMRLAL